MGGYLLIIIFFNHFEGFYKICILELKSVCFIDLYHLANKRDFSMLLVNKYQ